MSRLFTFGCSFTSWPWPTWADIIAYELKIPHENWGIPGIGNVGIHARLVECDLRNNFNEDDIILIVWSSWTREDRYNTNTTSYLGGTWNLTGDVTHSFDENFIKTYWSINNDLMKNSTAILSANKMLDIRFNGHIATPLSGLYDDTALSFNEDEKKVALFFDSHIPNDGQYQETGKHLCRYTKTGDSHPDILSHLDYTQEFICPKLNITLSKITVDLFEEMHYTLLDFTENKMNTSDGIDYRNKISVAFEKFNWKPADRKGF